MTEQFKFPRTLQLNGTIDAWGYAHYTDPSGKEYLLSQEDLCQEEQEQAAQHIEQIARHGTTRQA